MKGTLANCPCHLGCGIKQSRTPGWWERRVPAEQSHRWIHDRTCGKHLPGKQDVSSEEPCGGREGSGYTGLCELHPRTQKGGVLFLMPGAHCGA